MNPKNLRCEVEPKGPEQCKEKNEMAYEWKQLHKPVEYRCEVMPAAPPTG